MKDLEKILSIKEIDAFMIGPYDLSGSMGIPGEFENPKFIEVIEEINTIAAKTEKLNGIHVVEPDIKLLNQALEKYKFIAYSVDTIMLDRSFRVALNRDRLNKLKAIGVIPARMNSSRFPNKPLKNILGFPLIGHVFLRSKFIDSLDEVIVATCDVEILTLFAAWVVKLL